MKIKREVEEKKINREVQTKRRNSRKVIFTTLAILVASILAILSKMLLPDDTNVAEFDSFFVKTLSFPVVASLYFLLIYTHNAAATIFLGRRSTQSAFQTGLRFGACFGMIYLLGMQEVMVEASPYAEWGMGYVWYQLVMGAGEAMAALGLCVVLSRLHSQEKENRFAGKNTVMSKVAVTALITCFFTIERTVVYETGFISSDVAIFPIPTYAWTVLFGIVLGVCFLLLYPVFQNERTAGRRCLYSMVLTVGAGWMIFNSFIGFIYAGELGNLLLRSCMDVAAVFVAAWIGDRFMIRQIPNVQ